jgi:hypothetical protein
MRLGDGRCCISMCISLMCKSLKSPNLLHPSLLVTTQPSPLPLLPSLPRSRYYPAFPAPATTQPSPLPLLPSLPRSRYDPAFPAPTTTQPSPLPLLPSILLHHTPVPDLPFSLFIIPLSLTLPTLPFCYRCFVDGSGKYRDPERIVQLRLGNAFVLRTSS